MEYNYSKIDSPVGVLHLVSNSKKLVALVFNNCWQDFSDKFKDELISKKDAVIIETEKQLVEYFKGKRKDFKIPLKLSGTEFQNNAWKVLQKIPFGKTISYALQATKMKNPNAVRAVGSANGKNNICIIIPCHRVIAKSGSLAGFGGGLDIKKQLLKHENAL